MIEEAFGKINYMSTAVDFGTIGSIHIRLLCRVTQQLSFLQPNCLSSGTRPV